MKPIEKERLKQMWQQINEPKVIEILKTNKNGEPIIIKLDRIPLFLRKRKKNKKMKEVKT